MPVSRPNILIAGASARAATFSAIRRGLVVAAADLFADRDLAFVADVTVIKRWPDDIELWASRYPSSVPFVYTGGLENHPDLLRRIGRERLVAGNVGKPLESARTPESLYAILTARNIPVAQLSGSVCSSEVQWLLKPRRGAGGRGVRLLSPGFAANLTEEYLQEFIAGTAGSAAFLVAAGGNVECLGMCESLVGLDPTAHRFAYYGSIVRRDWKSELLEQAGQALAAIGLRGLLGIDFIHTPDGRYVVVEVNPRFTASMELYELSSGRSLVAEHLDAFGALPSRSPSTFSLQGSDAVFGKRIVYAPHDLTCDLVEPPIFREICSGAYVQADLPQREAIVEAATPICTVIAQAEDGETCSLELEKRERAVLAACAAIDSRRGD